VVQPGALTTVWYPDGIMCMPWSRTVKFSSSPASVNSRQIPNPSVGSTRK